MGSYGDNECKLLNLWQISILKKGCIWEIMILKKGSLGDNDPEKRGLWEIMILKKGSLGDRNNVSRKRVFGGA